ncbi:MAG: DUF1304 domain-containing protein [Chloroflexota bacterium]
MNLINKILVTLVALEHLYILVLEMFLWTTPRALRVFDMTMEVAEITQPLAINQGLYNGFLAAGLVWALLHPNEGFGRQIAIFFLLCVVAAAILGGITAGPSIFVVQGTPAILALLSLWFWRRQTQTS